MERIEQLHFATMTTDFPNFRSRRMLMQHIEHTMAFYFPRAIDPSGGFYHFFMDDGSVYDAHTRHLVSSTRFIFTLAQAYRHFGQAVYLDQVRHGLQFLREVHRNPETGGYAWLLHWPGESGESGEPARVLDGDNHCYGLAFVLLAYAHALRAGVAEAREWLEETYDLMEARFWQAEYGLYADQASSDWQVVQPYRGQNANMHACEAMLAAYAATDDLKFLHRAETLARHIALR
ncbi:MAG: hypothetical protein RL748_3732, partial [Pseudomonadota bacterium]